MNNIYLKIDSINAKGEGVGRYNNLVVFVPFGIPGDYLEVKVISKKTNYWRALISKILEPSPFRVKPKCPKIGECGSCQLQELDYPIQLKEKQKILTNALYKIAKLQTNFDIQITASPLIYEYRNKCQYPVQNNNDSLLIGYYAPRSHKIINYIDCLLHPKVINKSIKVLKNILEDYKVTGYNEKLHKGVLRHIIARYSFTNNNILLGLVTNEKFNHFNNIAKDIMNCIPNCVGVIQNINNSKSNVILGNKNIPLIGNEYISENIDNIVFYYSISNFFQVNTMALKELCKVLIPILNLSGKETVIDAYCGIGLFSLLVSKHVSKVYGIEIVKDSIKYAIFNAKQNNIDNCEFITGKVEDILPNIIKDSTIIDIIILDPPREGLDKQVINAIIEYKIPKIIYISCEPSTLARDLNIFASNGYKLNFCQAIDMFPHTYHVETITMLEL